MHNCLTIQELVGLITEFCVDGELETDRHTLLAIASTCRTFEEPALDRLWYKLESLRPLFKCLPQDAWEEKMVAADPEIGHRAGDTSMVSDSVLFASALNIILFCLLKRTWGAVSTQTIGSELTFTPIEWKFSAAVTFTPGGAWHSLIPKYSMPLHCVTARFPLSFPAYLIWGGMRTNSCTPTSHYSLVHGSLSYRSAFRAFQTSPARTLLHLLKNDLHLFDTCGLIKLTRYIDTI